MTKYVALLRAVGGKRRAPSADLRQVAEELGLGTPATYIASGNLLFTSERDPDELAVALQPALSERLGFSVPVIVVPHQDLVDAVAGNPFEDGNPSRVSVTFLDTPLPPALRDELQAAVVTPERLELGGPDAQWLYVDFADGQANSKLARKLLTPMRGVVATTRNIRTTTALRDRLAALVDHSNEDQSG